MKFGPLSKDLLNLTVWRQGSDRLEERDVAETMWPKRLNCYAQVYSAAGPLGADSCLSLLAKHTRVKLGGVAQRFLSDPVQQSGAWLAAAFLALLCLFLLQELAQAQLQPIRRVLILNELGIVSSPGYREIDEAAFAALQKSRYQIELYNESLEVTLFPDTASQRRFRAEFIRRYSNRKPDVIIAAGPASLKFIAELHDGFFAETPVVFCGNLEEVLASLKLNVHFTGVWGEPQPEKTLQAALQLLPNTKHVVVAGGIGEFDREFQAIAKKGFQNYSSKLDFTYLTDLAMPALLERLKHLPSDTIIYHTAITQDALGERFVDSTQSVPLVVGAANAPVFVMDDVDFRAGAVGGDLVNWADDGRVAAEIAVRILNGEKPQDIPIVTSNNAYMFDYLALKRWGLKASALPPGSIIVNRPPNFWQLYGRYVLAGFFVILAQALAILALLWQRMRRRKAEALLRESEGRFRLVANTAPVMIWMSGTDKLCTFFNQTWLEFTGRSLREQLGYGWAEGVHTEDLKTCLDTYTAAFDRRESFQMEYRLRRHDGEYLWIFDYGVPRFNADGSFAGYIGSASDITDRKLAEEALAGVSRKLIEAHEEERTWIARELHDDVNQRIALMTVNLESLKQNLPASEIQTRYRIEATCQQIGDLGSDIQALSHRLHSSKLEYLGLTTACDGFCRELSERQNVEIDFRSENVPKNLSKESSLCLFRVLQEALQNAVKHSGVQQFQVSLKGSSNEVELSVHDSGIGFDLDRTMVGHGLGLISMKERLKLVAGHLTIDAKPRCGTTVHARVPFT